jgi:hypothetical protein
VVVVATTVTASTATTAAVHYLQRTVSSVAAFGCHSSSKPAASDLTTFFFNTSQLSLFA